MSLVYNTYALKELETMSVEDAAMHDSPSNSNSMNTSTFKRALVDHAQGDPSEDNTSNTHGGECEEQLILKTRHFASSYCSAACYMRKGYKKKNAHM